MARFATERLDMRQTRWMQNEHASNPRTMLERAIREPKLPFRAAAVSLASRLHSGTPSAAFARASAPRPPSSRSSPIACGALPLSFFIARDVWTWVALIASLLLVLAIEFLNTAIERLCNHIQPDKHDAIRITKDLASAGVFLTLALAGLVWIAAIFARFRF